MTKSSHLLLFVVNIDLSRIIPRLHLSPCILKNRACPTPPTPSRQGLWSLEGNVTACFLLLSRSEGCTFQEVPNQTLRPKHSTEVGSLCS